MTISLQLKSTCQYLTDFGARLNKKNEHAGPAYMNKYSGIRYRDTSGNASVLRLCKCVVYLSIYTHSINQSLFLS